MNLEIGSGLTQMVFVNVINGKMIAVTNPINKYQRFET
jgi:hypothetical protein